MTLPRGFLISPHGGIKSLLGRSCPSVLGKVDVPPMKSNLEKRAHLLDGSLPLSFGCVRDELDDL